MHVVKWPNILQISCGVYTARFLKYVWPFCNIMHEKFKIEAKFGIDKMIKGDRKASSGRSNNSSFFIVNFENMLR